MPVVVAGVAVVVVSAFWVAPAGAAAGTVRLNRVPAGFGGARTASVDGAVSVMSGIVGFVAASSLSFSSLALAARSSSFLRLASRSFNMACASISCFSHLEKILGPRGLALVLSDRPVSLVLLFRLIAREVDAIRLTVGALESTKGFMGLKVLLVMEWRA